MVERHQLGMMENLSMTRFSSFIHFQTDTHTHTHNDWAVNPSRIYCIEKLLWFCDLNGMCVLFSPI
jgi:hypothetical protein